MRMQPVDLPLVRGGPPRADLLICFSHLRWHFVYQRPQHLLSRAAAAWQVWFFEEPVFEDMDMPGRLRIEPQPCGVVVIVPVLKHGSTIAEQTATQRDLLDCLLSSHHHSRLMGWYYTPMALKFSDHLEFSVCVYDCMDELSAFNFAPPELTMLEQTLMQRAQLMFTGGHSLYEAKRHHHQNCHAFPSAVDCAHFGCARNHSAEPADQASIPHPRVGFFGVIDERMDMTIVSELARLRPDLHFVLIGPVVKIDPASLPRAANLHWLGPKDYSVLPQYLCGWNAAFMPFAMNEATRFISPTKTPEFLAAGVPVCSAPVHDVINPYGTKGLVQIAATAGEFSDKLDLVLAGADDVWLERVDRFLAHVSWDETWERMRTLIESAAGETDSESALLATTPRAAQSHV